MPMAEVGRVGCFAHENTCRMQVLTLLSMSHSARPSVIRVLNIMLQPVRSNLERLWERYPFSYDWSAIVVGWSVVCLLLLSACGLLFFANILTSAW